MFDPFKGIPLIYVAPIWMPDKMTRFAFVPWPKSWVEWQRNSAVIITTYTMQEIQSMKDNGTLQGIMNLYSKNWREVREHNSKQMRWFQWQIKRAQRRRR